MAVTQARLDTRVADVPRLDVHARIARRGGYRRLERLIIRIGPAASRKSFHSRASIPTSQVLVRSG